MYFFQLEQLCGLILVDGHVELVDGRRDLEPHEHDALHALQAHELGPPHEAVEVPLRLDVAAEPEVTRGLLEQRVLGGFFLLLS